MLTFKKHLGMMLLTLSYFLLTFATSTLAEDTGGYKLSAGDTIFIQVFNESAFTKQATLNNTGSFNYPYLGKVSAAGLTTEQLQQKLLNALKPDYLTQPVISVELSQYHGIYVTGEVKNPGYYNYRQNLTIRQAIALAGGFNSRANTQKIWFIKAGSNQAVEVKPSTALNPGDTVQVKKGSVFF